MMILTKALLMGLALGAVLALGLGECNGYSLFDPATCWAAVEYGGEAPLWGECR